MASTVQSSRKNSNINLQVSHEKISWAKAGYIFAIVSGIFVFLGAVGFGTVGLLKSYKVIPWSDTKLQWLTSAIKTMSTDKHCLCLWGILTSGVIVGGGLIAFGSYKMHHALKQTNTVQQTNTNTTTPTTNIPAQPRKKNEDAPLKAICCEWYDSMLKGDDRLEILRPSESFPEKHYKEIWFKGRDKIFVVKFADGIIGCSDKVKIGSTEDTNLLIMLKENGYKEYDGF